MPVHADAENGDGGLVVLYDHRHRRCHHIGGIGAENEIDFVDIDELGVDAGHVRRIALIVVVDELDWAAEQTALGVDIVAPELQRDQKLLAVLRHPAGHRHAEADLDWLTGVRACLDEQQRGRRKHQYCRSRAAHRRGAFVRRASRHDVLPFSARRPERRRFRSKSTGAPPFAERAFLLEAAPRLLRSSLHLIISSFRRPA